jgi:hypothetical protein
MKIQDHIIRRCLRRCPYWCNQSRRCTISRNGLFIPLENQISAYCVSEKYDSCRQYKEEQILLQAEREVVSFNRRKHPRAASEYSLTLRFLSDTNKLIWHTAGMAKTINLSDGGMQITTKGPLFSDSIVRFSYVNSDTSQRLGLARVKWCHYRQEIMKYVAGLCFYKFKALRKSNFQSETLN